MQRRKQDTSIHFHKYLPSYHGDNLYWMHNPEDLRRLSVFRQCTGSTYYRVDHCSSYNWFVAVASRMHNMYVILGPEQLLDCLTFNNPQYQQM